MNNSNKLQNPTLIVVTGRPGSGKTTLAHKLAREIRCPLISRDEIKEGLVNTVGNHSELDLNRHVYGTYFDTLALLLRQHISLVTEAAFQHKLWQPQLDPLRDMANIRIVYCTIDGETAKTRFIERGASDPDRANFHDDMGIQANTDISGTLLSKHQPPRLDVPMLTVDTSDGYHPTFEAIVSFLRQS